MKQSIIYSIVVLLPIFVNPASANDSIPNSFSVADSIIPIEDPSLLKKFSDFSFKNGEKYVKSPLDTSLTFVHRYNPAVNSFAFSTGNVGQAHNSFIFEPADQLGFRFWRNQFRLWEIFPEDIFHYSTRIPYTETFLVIGPQQEQFFKALHTQNVNDNLNFGFVFNKIRSDNFYPNQNSNITNAGFQINYLSNDKRYGILGKVFFNGLAYRENGGLRNDDFIYDQDTRLLSVNLNSAFARRNSRGFSIKQYYNYKVKEDSVWINDSTTTKTFQAQRGLFHETSFTGYRYRYIDSNAESDFYLNFGFPLDTLATFDSLAYKVFNNDIGFNDFNSLFSYSASIGHQYAEVFNIGSLKDNYISNFFLSAKAETEKINNFRLNLSGSYLILGAQQGDYRALGRISYEGLSWGELFFVSTLANSAPEFLFTSFRSNQFNWDRSFLKTSTFSNNLMLINKIHLFKISARASSIQNYLYFDQSALPVQDPSGALIFQLSADKMFRFRMFRFSQELIYQNTNRADIIRLPDLISRSSAFIEFGKHEGMKLQLGIDLTYFSAFFNYAYMPVTSQFFIQNEKQQGAYPFADFFVNLRVKQVRAFIKLEHLNQGLSDATYSVFPYYPYNPRGIRFGLSWVYLN
jgi:hypothetical protein